MVIQHNEIRMFMRIGQDIILILANDTDGTRHLLLHVSPLIIRCHNFYYQCSILVQGTI